MTKKKSEVAQIGEFIGSALVPDPTPIATPAKALVKPGLAEQVRQLVHSEQMRAAAESAGFETPEEADDFNVGDDYEPDSPYEIDLDPSTDDDDELDRRIGGSVKRVFEAFGLKIPADGDPNPATPPVDEEGVKPSPTPSSDDTEVPAND